MIYLQLNRAFLRSAINLKPSLISSFHASRYILNNANKSQINEDILSLVPTKGKVGIIDQEGKFSNNVNLKKFLQRQFDKNKYQLVVVKFSHHHQHGNKAGFVEEGESEDPLSQDQLTHLPSDPDVVCKVVPLPEGEIKVKPKRDNKPKKSKPMAVKDIPISWNIALSDLSGQKKLAIQSVLSRGHSLQLQLDSKQGMRYPRQLSPLEVEKRNLLIDKCHEICSEWGTKSHKQEGTIASRVTLFYAPKKS